MAEELLDTGVNCGTGFAKPLQRALNLLNNQGKAGYADLEVDGVYGSETLRALKPIWPNAERRRESSGASSQYYARTTLH